MRSTVHFAERTITAALCWTPKCWVFILLVLLISPSVPPVPRHTDCCTCCHCPWCVPAGNWECQGGSREVKEAKGFRTSSRVYQSHWEPSQSLCKDSIPVITSEPLQQALLHNFQQRNFVWNFLSKHVPISQILFPAKKSHLTTTATAERRGKLRVLHLSIATVQWVLVNGSEIGVLGCSCCILINFELML